MDINIFGINDSSWIKKICWRSVFLVLFVICVVLRFAPGCILRFIGCAGLGQNLRNWIGVLMLLFGLSFVVCAIPDVLKWFWQWKDSLQWKGKHARDKILSLSWSAQEQVREIIERGTPLKLFKESDVYLELMDGKFVETSMKDKNIAVCRLRGWVVECFKRYPDLVGALHEMDPRERDFV